MTIVQNLCLLFAGSIIGHLIPHILPIVMTRSKSSNRQFPSHPQPIPLSANLNKRILEMRNWFWAGTICALIPLAFGWASLKSGSVAFGIGLWLSSGWVVLNRLQLLMTEDGIPWSRKRAETLQLVLNSNNDSPCCNLPQVEWELSSVRCNSCRHKFLDIPRPDLGRNREDSKFSSFFRLWISGGLPVVVPEESK